ncbi:MAG: hypothetical protein IIA35_01005 [Proteobacteria bacterium]|nr:hypothetical protein [Pseudomonadota bacterium]
MHARTIAKALGGRKAGGCWMARCPAHDDREPSLSISTGDQGKVLVRCHAGCDQAMVIAVLEARCGVSLAGRDVYLNVAGGLRITEPAADLAVAAALASSLTDLPMPPKTVVFGEIGLSGEVRPVGQRDSRLKEAAKLGFTQALAPPRVDTASAGRRPAIKVRELRRLADLLALFDGTREARRRRERHQNQAAPQ